MRILRRLGRVFTRGAPVAHPSAPAPILAVEAFDSLVAFELATRGPAASWSSRRAAEAAAIPAGDQGWLEGYCHVCAAPRRFLIDFLYAAASADGSRVPNWRERLVCEGCGLNNRVRASIQLFETRFAPAADSRIYLTEQTTPLYAHLSRRYPNLVGSEFLGVDREPGEHSGQGLRHEDFTRLSFPPDSLDFILTFDVLEHVPNYRKALSEAFRCLAPGGRMLLTAPFRAGEAATLVRAELDAEAGIRHLETPEYHGDPVNPAGCLCFYHFGWDLLDALRSLGFMDVNALTYWSLELGYLGAGQIVIVAQKPQEADRTP